MAYERVSNREFSAAKWKRLEAAIIELLYEGIYKKFVGYHRKAHDVIHSYIHSHGDWFSPLFLPWHRIYLLEFEKELRKVDSDLSIPYWDWGKDNGHLKGFDKIHLITGAKRPTDSQTGNGFFERVVDQENEVKRKNTFECFSRALERLHNGGHGLFGRHSTMNNGHESPRDPAFWFHHAQIDRLWAKWQKEQQHNKPAPDLMFDLGGISYAVPLLEDINRLGYKYRPPSQAN